MTNTSPKASSGVETLIQRLKTEGVVAGQEKAEAIVTDAQKRAKWIIEEAELEARNIRDKAKKEAEAFKSAGQDALNLAVRDALIKLRDSLLNSFSQEVMRVVGKEMSEQDFLQQIILSLASTVRGKTAMDQNQKIIFSLPEETIGVDQLRQNPKELEQGALTYYTASIAANLLRKGVSFKLTPDIKSGLSVRLVDDAIIIDFTDEVVTDLLLEHLQPRFRALLQGIVK